MVLKGLKAEFSKMQNAYEKDDKIRDEIISLSRTILKSSKQAIYAIHRNEIKKATAILDETESNVLKARKILMKYKSKTVGAYSASLEEYVEAKCYLSYVTSETFPSAKHLNVSPNVYLLGLSDCTGELARRAVQLAINKKYFEIKKIHETLEELTGLFLHIEFRGIDMRKKLEGLKYNVTKTQNILYDIEMKQKN